jgi:hypothetical protein
MIPSYPAPSRAIPIVSPSVDPSFYGLSHYALHHREREGLSDITEEDSNVSGSVASAGDGARSPVRHEPLQGFGVASDALRALISDREAQWQRTLHERELHAAEEDENPTTDADDEGADDSSSLPSDIAFSPPGAPQPGPSIPLVSSGRQSMESLDASGVDTSGDGTEGTPSRKKPKGDVWW